MSKWFTLDEAAAELRVGRTTLWQYMKPEAAPRLKGIRLGRKVVIPEESLAAFKDELTRAAGLEPASV